MELAGQEIIPQPKEAVWAALNDVDILKQCIPGCDTLEWLADDRMGATVTLKVGPIKASFKGEVTLSELSPPDGYTISGEGSGGVAGAAKGSAKVVLENCDEGTLLRYSVNSHVSGKIAQLGSRLIDATARKLAQQFFTKFTSVVSSV